MKLPTETTKRAKILIYDLEVSPTLGWTYGLWDTRVIKVEKQPIIMSFSYRWHGEKKVHHSSLLTHDFMLRPIEDVEKDLVTELRDLFDEAEILVAHNANRFDNKVATAAFLRHNLHPPSPSKTVDTLRVARGVARFGSNSLDSLCDLFGIGRKSKVTHHDLWYDCLNGSRAAWAKMRTYNNQDVELLTGLYEKLLPYIKNHPNLGDINQVDGVCPKCGEKKLEKRGFNMSRSGKKQRYQCKGCGGWCNEANIRKTGRTVNA